MKLDSHEEKANPSIKELKFADNFTNFSEKVSLSPPKDILFKETKLTNKPVSPKHFCVFGKNSKGSNFVRSHSQAKTTKKIVQNKSSNLEENEPVIPVYDTTNVNFTTKDLDYNIPNFNSLIDDKKGKKDKNSKGNNNESNDNTNNTNNTHNTYNNFVNKTSLPKTFYKNFNPRITSAKEGERKLHEIVFESEELEKNKTSNNIASNTISNNNITKNTFNNLRTKKSTTEKESQYSLNKTNKIIKDNKEKKKALLGDEENEKAKKEKTDKADKANKTDKKFLEKAKKLIQDKTQAYNDKNFKLPKQNNFFMSEDLAADKAEIDMMTASIDNKNSKSVKNLIKDRENNRISKTKQLFSNKDYKKNSNKNKIQDYDKNENSEYDKDIYNDEDNNSQNADNIHNEEEKTNLAIKETIEKISQNPNKFKETNKILQHLGQFTKNNKDIIDEFITDKERANNIDKEREKEKLKLTNKSNKNTIYKDTKIEGRPVFGSSNANTKSIIINIYRYIYSLK